ncbi:cupin domain-containing protein [Geoalkalibacter sp.]|uniref:cupin domain-containing protein n=1 Tax=Geoalkalibacter sp. TaxID=3041440 RepID=UPI00272EC32F|nr:cupin domain-containing protein [Geoalkalibacter sp.]
MDTTFFAYQDQVAFSPDKAHKVVLAATEHSRTTLWCLAPGQDIHPHVHAGDHIWVILEGRGTFLGDHHAERPVEPGLILVAPTGRAHGIRNDGDKGLVFVSISAG